MNVWLNALLSLVEVFVAYFAITCALFACYFVAWSLIDHWKGK